MKSLAPHFVIGRRAKYFLLLWGLTIRLAGQALEHAPSHACGSPADAPASRAARPGL